MIPFLEYGIGLLLFWSYFERLSFALPTALLAIPIGEEIRKDHEKKREDEAFERDFRRFLDVLVGSFQSGSNLFDALSEAEAELTSTSAEGPLSKALSQLLLDLEQLSFSEARIRAGLLVSRREFSEFLLLVESAYYSGTSLFEISKTAKYELLRSMERKKRREASVQSARRELYLLVGMPFLMVFFLKPSQGQPHPITPWIRLFALGCFTISFLWGRRIMGRGL